MFAPLGEGESTSFHLKRCALRLAGEKSTSGKLIQLIYIIKKNYENCLFYFKY